jgi:hypothetical protein
MERSTRAIPVVVCIGAVCRAREPQSHPAERGVAVVRKPLDRDRPLEQVANLLDPDTAGSCRS